MASSHFPVPRLVADGVEALDFESRAVASASRSARFDLRYVTSYQRNPNRTLAAPTLELDLLSYQTSEQAAARTAQGLTRLHPFAALAQLVTHGRGS
jgi:hypothetical protein